MRFSYQSFHAINAVICQTLHTCNLHLCRYALSGLCRDRIELWWHRSWPSQDRRTPSDAALLSMKFKGLPEACRESYSICNTVTQNFARKNYLIAVQNIQCRKNG